MITKAGSVIVFYGDSITDAGRIDDPAGLGNGYVKLLADQLPDQTVVNAGVGGNRAIDLQARLTEDVLPHRPDLVSIMIGINDTWRRFDRDDATTPDDFERRYADIARRITDAGAGLVLLEPFVLPVTDEQATAWREDLEPRIAVVHRLAEEYQAPVVRLDAELNRLAEDSSTAALAADGVHPTERGHSEVARLWLETVRG